MCSEMEDLVNRFGQGSMVILTDDEDREGEGDMVIAGAHCSEEVMTFLIRHGCGIVCAPLSAAVAQRLHLAPMVQVNTAPLSTAFTVSVDLRVGLRTGISAAERAATVRLLADPNSIASDFVQPGHLFPLRAHPGGVAARPGHTEGAIELCRRAKLAEVAAICELFNDDGTVMRGADIRRFAERHSLPIASIAALEETMIGHYA